MPLWKITRTMEYTETGYIEADSNSEAETESLDHEFSVNHDDTWTDSSAEEITEEQYINETE